MDKHEKIIQIPSCYISKELSDRIAVLINQIAQEQENRDYAQALRDIAPKFNLTPEQAITQYWTNLDVRRLLIFRKDSITFVSPHGNVQYLGRDVSYDEIPCDPSQVTINVPGIDGKYINVSMNADLMKHYPLQSANTILIQGADKAWVNDVYNELKTLIDTHKKPFRNFIYRWLRPIGFITLVILSLLEFRLFQFVNNNFDLFTPLSGLAIILVFVLLLFNHNMVFIFGAKLFQYLYPYFELEDRLSHARKDYRKFAIAGIVALYGGGLVCLVRGIVRLLFG